MEMMPIDELLNKIKWDKRETPCDYVVFYFDRVEKKLQELPYQSIGKVLDGFIVTERGGEETYIPLHRVRFVERRGEVVWQRPVMEAKA